MWRPHSSHILCLAGMRQLFRKIPRPDFNFSSPGHPHKALSSMILFWCVIRRTEKLTYVRFFGTFARHLWNSPLNALSGADVALGIQSTCAACWHEWADDSRSLLLKPALSAILYQHVVQLLAETCRSWELAGPKESCGEPKNCCHAWTRTQTSNWH